MKNTEYHLFNMMRHIGLQSEQLQLPKQAACYHYHN